MGGPLDILEKGGGVYPFKIGKIILALKIKKEKSINQAMKIEDLPEEEKNLTTFLKDYQKHVFTLVK